MNSRFSLLHSLLAILILAGSSRSQQHFGEEREVLTTTRYPSSLTIADLTGDGRPDVLIGKGGGLKPDELWVQQPDGSFQMKASAALVKQGPLTKKNGTGPMLCADFDGDGDLDIIRQWSMWLGRSVVTREILWNAGGGNFKARSPLPGSGGLFGALIRAVDIDGDKDIDLVLAEGWAPGFTSSSYYFGKPRLFLNQGKGTFLETALPLPKEYVVPVGLHILDLDENGTLDIFIPVEVKWYGRYNPSKTLDHPLVFLNQGKKGWLESSSQIGIPTSFECTWRSVLMDLDGDGDSDFATVAKDGRSIRLLENIGKGKFRVRSTGLLSNLKGGIGALKPLRLPDQEEPCLWLAREDPKTGQQEEVYRPGKNFTLTLVPTSQWLVNGRGHYRGHDAEQADLDGDADLDLVYFSWKDYTLRFRSSLRQELVSAPPRLGKPWKLALARTPLGLKNPGAAILGISLGVSTKALRVAGIGNWFLPPTVFVWTQAHVLPSPLGVTGWAPQIPAGTSWLGTTVAAQGLCWDPKAGWAVTRAVSGKITR